MVARRRQNTSSKTLFDLLVQYQSPENDQEHREDSSNCAMSPSTSASGNSRSGDNVRSFLRRSTSRLLLMLKLRSIGSGTDKLPPPSQLEIAESVDNRTTSGGNSAQIPLGQSIACDIDGRAPTLLGPSNSSNSPREPTPDLSEDIFFMDESHERCSGAVLQIEGRGRKRSVLNVPRRESSPGLTDILSHKLSTTLDHPTVIYRSNRRRRPNIREFSIVSSSHKVLDLQRLGDNALDSSNSSSLSQHGGASSPRSQSTDPTSDGVPLSPISKHLHKANQLSKDCLTGPDFSQCLDCQPGRIVPTIITVEAAAAAKIFLETYFNEIFSTESPRQQRQRELEQRLYISNFPPDERVRIKEAWYRQESEHLRQARCLKNWSNRFRPKDSLSTAGYDIIGVLGKGSFGIVRLVREKQLTKDSSETSNLDADGDGNHKRLSTIEALRSAVDGTVSRRRNLKNLKKDVYAMKVIRKSNMIRNCQEGHLRAERDFLVAAARSRWIVPLIASFQDAHNLYLVMDYMIGGDFLSLLIRKNTLREDVAKWYIAEMILCVEETHRLRWIHRDIKPDNFLISASGHLKISDFGLAFDGHWSHDQSYFINQRQSLMSKLGIEVQGDKKDREVARTATAQKQHNVPANPGPGPNDDILHWRNRKERRRFARSIVGTSQYMAPEVIRGDSYDGRCDWWSIGVILFECLYGFTPFSAKTRQETKDKILNYYEELYFPVERSSDLLISDEAVDLLVQLLTEKKNRLCSPKYLLNDFAHSDRLGELLDQSANSHLKSYRGDYVYPDDAAEIKNHPFFKGTRWDELHYRTPPFVPKIRGWEDTKYFDSQQVSDVQDGSSDESSLDEPAQSRGGSEKRAKSDMIRRFTASKSGNAVKNGNLNGNLNLQSKSHKKKREKKRARDKCLRDEQIGKTVLEMRKRNAFVGYTYRRPKDVLLPFEPERGRSITQTER